MCWQCRRTPSCLCLCRKRLVGLVRPRSSHTPSATCHVWQVEACTQTNLVWWRHWWRHCAPANHDFSGRRRIFAPVVLLCCSIKIYAWKPAFTAKQQWSITTSYVCMQRNDMRNATSKSLGMQEKKKWTHAVRSIFAESYHRNRLTNRTGNECVYHGVQVVLTLRFNTLARYS